MRHLAGAGQRMRRVVPPISLLLGLLSGLVIGGCRERRKPKPPPAKTQPKAEIPPKPKPVKILYPSAPGSFVRVVTALRPSLVNLFTLGSVTGGPKITLPARRGADDPFFATSPFRSRILTSLGSGVILDRAGHVITALHVVQTARDIRARLHDNKELKAKLVGHDPDTGIAVLRLVDPPLLTPARFGDSSQLHPGDWVVAAGNPFGVIPYVSAGLVSYAGSNKSVTLMRPGYFSFIMTDARINAANAGGPLVNTAGEVIGINVLFEGRERHIGFAVPFNMIRDILPTLLKHGTVARSWLGIYVKKVTATYAASVGLDPARGAWISEVIKGGPADLAGLRAGDIILEYDGKTITRQEELPFLAARSPTGKTVLVKVWRGRRAHVLTVRPENKPQ